MLTQEEVYERIREGSMSPDEFEWWCSELRAAAVEDAEFAASAYGA